MTGTLINGAAILTGGTIGLAVKNRISPATQHAFRLLLGLAVVYVGMSMTWTAIRESPAPWIADLGILFLALILGNLIGKSLGLQRRLDRLGRWAAQRVKTETPSPTNRFAEGFVTATILFCVGPMAVLGSLADGLEGEIRILAIKAAMDGFTTLFFVTQFGWGVMLSVVPVVLYQGTITLAARLIAPGLEQLEVTHAIHGTGGLLVICVSALVLETQRAPIANYLPALVVAPTLAWLFFH